MTHRDDELLLEIDKAMKCRYMRWVDGDSGRCDRFRENSVYERGRATAKKQAIFN